MTKSQSYEDRAGAAARFIRDYWVINQFAPSMSEIAEHLGYSSKASVDRLIKRMIEDGTIEVGPRHAARTIRVRGSQVSVPEAPRNKENELDG
jgi:SOS-response transcriptional repressor LexA